MEFEYLRVEDVARLIGVTEKTIRGYINRGELKASKLGTIWRIHPADVESFMNEKSNQQNGGNEQ